METVEIDASILEGGGQIFRTSISLGTILNISCHVYSIRNNRPNPGLAKQHLTVTYIIESLGFGRFEGNTLGSPEVQYIPRKFSRDHSSTLQRIDQDVGSAGSITLILQAIMPILIFQTHPTLLTLRGGTNVSFSPPIDHFQHILLPLLSKMGINAQLASDHRRGYYPVGGGKVQISIDGNGVLHPIILTEPGKVESIICVIFGNNDEIQLSLKSHLECALGEYISLIGERISSNFEGIRIVLNTLTPQSQQEKRSNSQGKSSSKIGNKKKKIVNSSVGVQIIISTSTGNILSANSLICERDDDLLQCAPLNITTDIMNQLKNLIESGSCIDEHTADQLLVYMALANSCADTSTPGSMKESILVIEPFIEGKSSQHLETSVYLLNQILGPRGCRVNLEIDPITRCRIITCVGIGYLPC